MSLIKSGMVGMMIGVAIGAMNSDKVMGLMNNGKRKMMRFRRKYSM